MAGLLDLLMQARESGRGARADLENSINYYIPPELRGLLGLAAEANPVVSMERAGQDAQRLVQPGLSGWDRMAAAGDMASNMAGVLAPMAAARAVGMPAVRALEEGLLGMSMTPEAAALRQFAGDEFGGIKAFQGSPHNFPAERLVRMPDGSTQYVVGAPDVLPNIPAGAEVLRDFPLGRQRMDKIGTGEGAQAYGHGLYFAENEGIGQFYRDSLSDFEWTVNGKPYDAKDPAQFAAATLKQYPSAEAALRDLASQNAEYSKINADYAKLGIAKNNDVIARIKAGGLPEITEKSSGKVYEVNINADPADFLDWDKPLSEQPNVLGRLGYSTMDEDAAHAEAVRIFEENPNGAWMNDPALKARVDELNNMLDRRPPSGTGQDLYRGGASDDVSGILSQMGYGDPAAQSQALRDAGIPGIRYLDAGSRNFTPTTIKEGPSGAELYWGNDPRPVDTFPTRQAAEEAAKQFDTRSRNYVVFDENLIDIVRKYGIAGAAAMLGASQADVAQAMQQQRPQGLLSGPQ
jgi:hypothetical protein